MARCPRCGGNLLAEDDAGPRVYCLQCGRTVSETYTGVHMVGAFRQGDHAVRQGDIEQREHRREYMRAYKRRVRNGQSG